MSYTAQQSSFLEDKQAEFDQYLANKNWSEAREVWESVGDLGYEHESMLMLQAYNRAKNGNSFTEGMYKAVNNLFV